MKNSCNNTSTALAIASLVILLVVVLVVLSLVDEDVVVRPAPILGLAEANKSGTSGGVQIFRQY
jgi:hypothetical protein